MGICIDFVLRSMDVRPWFGIHENVVRRHGPCASLYADANSPWRWWYLHDLVSIVVNVKFSVGIRLQFRFLVMTFRVYTV